MTLHEQLQRARREILAGQLEMACTPILVEAPNGTAFMNPSKEFCEADRIRRHIRYMNEVFGPNPNRLKKAQLERQPDGTYKGVLYY